MYHFCFCFTLEGEDAYFSWWLLVYMRNSKRNNSILYGLWRSPYVRKKLKAERSKWFRCKTWRGFFNTNFLKKLRKNYSKFVWLFGKIIKVIQSLSFQLYEISIDYLFKVAKESNIKTMFGCHINKSIKLFKAKIYYSFIVSFVYLTYNFTNFRTKLYIFCISPALSQHTDIKTTLCKMLL